MFLRKLYHYNKLLFTGLLIFIVSFVYINLKWGVVAAPVFQYGMFSGVHKIKDPQTIYSIVANGKMIDLSKLSFEQRDVLVQQLELYMKYRNVNTFVATVMQFTGQLTSDERWKKIYQPVFNDSVFSSWYKRKLSQVLDEPVNSIEAYRQTFQYKDKNFRPSSAQEKLPFIVP